MTQQLHGVNLGGWLLLEKWMTPALFSGTDAADEHSFMALPGAIEKIKQHRETFITEADFIWMSSNGINAVRIPVGYWVLGGDAPFVDASKYLDWAIDMAQKYHLQVIIDLHGLKGSQNGRDHSGQEGKSLWFRSKAYQRQTIEVLVAIADRYRDVSNVWGIQVINEPRLGVFHFTLRRFYRQAYAQLIKVMRPGTRFIYSDAFTPRLMSGALKAIAGYPVVMDVHIYHMTTLWSQYRSLSWFMKKTKRRSTLLHRLSRRQEIIIGEWSGVLRHDLARTIPSSQQDVVFAQYIQQQLGAFGQTAGWFYWNYKTEAPGQWNFRSQVEAGLIVPPNP